MRTRSAQNHSANAVETFKPAILPLPTSGALPHANEHMHTKAQ